MSQIGKAWTSSVGNVLFPVLGTNYMSVLYTYDFCAFLYVFCT